MEDVEGLYTGLCSKRGRCIVGSCPWCDLKGQWMHNKVTFPGAVTFLPIDDPLRQAWQKEFKKVPGYRKLWNEGKPERMTLQKANESADAVQAAKQVCSCCHPSIRHACTFNSYDLCMFYTIYLHFFLNSTSE